MRMCQHHWDMLRAAIADRGMAHLVPSNGEGAAKLAAAGTPDPLMSAMFSITANALDVFGPGIMGVKEDGTPYCPICVGNEACAAAVAKGDPCKAGMPGRCGEMWIEHAANDELASRTRDNPT